MNGDLVNSKGFVAKVALTLSCHNKHHAIINMTLKLGEKSVACLAKE